MSNAIVQKIITLFNDQGDSEYGGEPVTQGEHALQAAHLALTEGAASSLVAASLLHDIGHLLHALPDDAPEQGIDDLHEELGNRFLIKYFTPAVSEPVHLHVAAKRYLCAVEPAYFALLSEPSVISLHLQGGPMTAEECKTFESNPYYQDAIQLRRYDDMAKIPNLSVQPIEFYAEFLRENLK
jgi:[1-hydroxy-2-(trimethylamino)ethyl]phosphonate dioxygenase